MSGPADDSTMDSNEPKINYSMTSPLPSKIPVMLAPRTAPNLQKLTIPLLDDFTSRFTFPRNTLQNLEKTPSSSTGSNHRIGSSPSNGSFDLVEKLSDLDSRVCEPMPKDYPRSAWKIYQSTKETDNSRQTAPRSPVVNRYMQLRGNEKKQGGSQNSSRPMSPKVIPVSPPTTPERSINGSPRNFNQQLRGKTPTRPEERTNIRALRGQKNNVTLSSMETKYKDQYKQYLKFQNNMIQLKEKLKESTKSLSETRNLLVNAGYTKTLPVPEDACEEKEETPKESKGTTTEGIEDAVGKSLSESLEKMESQKKVIAEKLQTVYSFLEQYQPIMEVLEEGKGDNLDMEISKLVDDVRAVESHQVDLEESMKNVAREFFEITEARNELLNVSENTECMNLMNAMREKLQDLQKQNQYVLEEKNDLQNEHQKEINKLYKRYEEELTRSSELEKELVLRDDICKKLELQTRQLQVTLHENQKQRNLDIVKPIEESLAIANQTISDLKSVNEELTQQIIKLRENGKQSDQSAKHLKAQIEEKERQVILFRRKMEAFESQQFHLLSMLKTIFDLKDEDLNDPEIMKYIKEADYENLKAKIKSLKLSNEPHSSPEHISALLKNEESNIPLNDLRDVVIHNLNKQLSQQKHTLLRLIKNMEDKNDLPALYSKEGFLGLAEIYEHKLSELKEKAESNSKNTNKISRKPITLPTGYQNVHRRNFYTWISYKNSVPS